MALDVTRQGSWGRGIFRGRSGPADAVYDAVNCLISGEGDLYRRGGSAYWSASNAGSTLTRVTNAYFAGPATDRTLAWGATELCAFTGAFAPLLVQAAALGRPVAVGDLLVFPLVTPTNQLVYYAGALTSGFYQAGTVTMVKGDPHVVGVGTSWLANVQPGSILARILPLGSPAVVKSVDSNTTLTLTRPWPWASVAATANHFFQAFLIIDAAVVPFASAGTSRLATAGTRLLFTSGNRVYLSPPGDPFTFTANDYHEIPSGMVINGCEGIGDTAVFFGSTGVWAIRNLSLDIVDDAGNVQHQVERINGDIVLWGEMGLASWNGQIVVPAVDDIYLMALDGSSRPITGDLGNERIRRMYRDYTKTAGYQPGVSCVHRGHLFMPILNGTTWVDTLVCRLDRGMAWTRWSGHAACTGFAVRPGSTSRAPSLLGTQGLRVADLSDCFDPTAANALDADGSAHACTIETRDYPTSGSNHPGTVARARLRYELEDDGSGATAAPTLALAWSADSEAGAFTALTGAGGEDGSVGGGASDGSHYSFWPVGKRKERLRFRVTVSGAAARFTLRTLELLIRQSGLR